MRFITSIIALLATVSVHAQQTATDANTSSAKLPSTAAPREDIDQEITNARLRASTGAKSLLSLQSTFNYNGGSVQEPLAKERPQLSPGTVENDPAKITGTISGKYRATDHDNVNLGVGLGWLTPSYDGQRGQVEDPYVAYTRVFRSGVFQNVFEVQLMKYTVESAVNESKLNYETTVDHTILAPLGNTKWQLGLNVAWSRELYSQRVNSGIQDTLAAFPFAEYEFSDRFSFRTVYRGLTVFNSVDRSDRFKHDDETQSMGIGISVTRDVYLYPNVQWVWQDMKPEKTNVALSTNINL